MQTWMKKNIIRNNWNWMKKSSLTLSLNVKGKSKIRVTIIVTTRENQMSSKRRVIPIFRNKIIQVRNKVIRSLPLPLIKQIQR